MSSITHLWWWTQFIHPGSTREHYGGYWFWSGIGSVGGFFTVMAMPLIVFYRHHNCHVEGCRKLGHIDPETHHPACKNHHSQAHKLQH